MTVSVSPVLTTRCTSTNASVSRPSLSEATSTHQTSSFFASNSYTSVSFAGKKLPATSQGSASFCGRAASSLGSTSAVPADAGSPVGGQENELTRFVVSGRDTGPGLLTSRSVRR